MTIKENAGGQNWDYDSLKNLIDQNLFQELKEALDSIPDDELIARITRIKRAYGQHRNSSILDWSTYGNNTEATDIILTRLGPVKLRQMIMAVSPPDSVISFMYGAAGVTGEGTDLNALRRMFESLSPRERVECVLACDEVGIPLTLLRTTVKAQAEDAVQYLLGIVSKDSRFSGLVQAVPPGNGFFDDKPRLSLLDLARESENPRIFGLIQSASNCGTAPTKGWVPN